MNETEQITQTVPADGSQNCKIQVYPGGAVVTVCNIKSIGA